MDDKALVCFRKVAELEHITKAASELFMSQSQLSRIIGEVEHELGAPLFDRSGRGIKLNEAGRVFYQYVLKIFIDYEEAREAVRNADQRRMFQISLGTNVGSYTLDLLSSLAKQLPGLSIRDAAAPRNALLAMLRDGRIDFAITSPPLHDIAINTQIVFNDLPAVIYPPGHWLAGRTRVSLDEIAGEPFVGVPQGYGARDAMTSYYQEKGITPHFAVETANTHMVEMYVEKGLGIALIPKSFALQSPYSQAHWLDLEEEVPCPIGISWVSDKILSDQQQQFLDFTSDFLRDHFGGRL